MTLHIFDDVVQGSDDWANLRRGLVTASAVGRLVTVGMLGAIDYACPACDAPIGDPCCSKRAPGAQIKTMHPERAAYARDQAAATLEVADDIDSRSLTETLVAERIAGWTEYTGMTSDMFRGVLYEPVAREAYAKHHAPVGEVGFMRRDEDGWTLGLSPDGLVGGDGLIEIKAPRAKTHVRTILADEVPAQYMAQCQAALLVSGREWLDFVSFCGGLPLYVKRVLPDRAWFAVIEAACRAFEETARAMVADYESRVVGLPMTERIDTELEMHL